MLSRKNLTFTVIYILLSLGSARLYAQIKVGGNATGRHAKVIKNAREARRDAQEQKAQAEKIREYLKAKKRYTEVFDSLKTVENDKFDQLKNHYQDSLEVSEMVLNDVNFPDEYKKYILSPDEFSQYTQDELNALALTDGEGYLEDQIANVLPQEMSQTSELETLSGTPLDQSATTPLAQIKKYNPNIISTEKAQSLFKKVNLQQFQNARASIQNLKKQYATLPDTRYTTGAIARNSLSQSSLKDRIFTGGNMNLRSTDPLILDLQLQFGYWINKKWLAGMSVLLREQFNQRDSSSLTGDAHGYSFFSRYDVGKGFFGWFEIENQLNKSIFPQSEFSIDARWEQTHLLGLGREYHLGQIKLMTMVLYDFNYRKNSLYARPFVFKLGFRLSKNPGIGG